MAEVTGHTRATLAYVAARLPAIASLFVLLVGIAWAGEQAHRWYDQWQASQIEQTDVFEYTSVEFSGDYGPNGELMMTSTVVYHRLIDRIVWDDRLACPGTWSDQTVKAEQWEPRPLRAIDWPYAGNYPTDGRECRMVSVITAQVGDRVFIKRVESDPFTPGEPDE